MLPAAPRRVQWQRTGDYVNFPFSSPFPPFVSRISTDAFDRIVVFTNSSGAGSWTLTAFDAPPGAPPRRRRSCYTISWRQRLPAA